MKKQEITKMNEKERNEKLKELEMELMKANVSSAKGSGSGKVKQIKKNIAKIISLNK
ncbi:MAG: 50S ribosomal protein L29 [Nanoarchaeota archaeon]